MEQVRAFIAIELPDEVRRALSRLQQDLKTQTVAPVKWVEPRNMHLTLKFLGNIGVDTVVDIVKALGEAAKGVSPLSLGVSGLGAFPDAGRARIIWVGLTGDISGLRRLQQNIDKALAVLNIPPEKRPFSPHLTLARLRDGATNADRREVGRLLEETDFTENPDFTAGSVYLIKSQLKPSGPVYSVLGSADLG